MKINELKIEKDYLKITKRNYILYRNLQDVLKFYKFFDDCINEKEKSITIEIGNKSISSKDYVLYNLLDIQSILDCLKYKKGSLVYEYVTDFINDNSVNSQNLEEYMQEFYQNILKKCSLNIRLTFEENISKIFQNSFDVLPIIENREEAINKLLNYIVKNTINKKFIIFVNSDLIKINLEEFDNVILFDINNKVNLRHYNLILYDAKRTNFNLEMLLNSLEINWPIDYNKTIVNDWLNYFFKVCFCKDTLYINNNELLIVSSLINKLMQLNMKIIYDTEEIDNIIKSFLADL